MKAAAAARESETSSSAVQRHSRGVGLQAPAHGMWAVATQASETEVADSQLQRRKLIINEPGDHYEQEADRVAEQVMRGTPPPSLGRALPSPRSLQRSCACGGTCADCHEQQRLQRWTTPGMTATRGSDAAPPIVHEVLRSPGQPLDPQTRAFMEPRFGRSFENVRVHAGARAAESARAVNARAYTVGPDIVFGANSPATDSAEHRRLLAHELVHVVQQEGVGRGADRGAAVRLRAAPAVQRDALDSLSEEDRKRLMNASVQCSTGQCHPARPSGKGALSDFGSAPFDANAMAKWLSAGQTQPTKAADPPSQPPQPENKAHAPAPPQLRPNAGKPAGPADRLQGLAPEMSREEMLRIAKDMSAADAARRREESQKRVLPDGTVISLAPPPPQAAKPVIPPPKPGELTRDIEVTLDAGGRTAVLAKANVEGERARIIHNLDGELHRIESIGDMCRTAAHKFLEEWPILRRLADLTGGATPPSDAIWIDVDRQIEKSRIAIRQGSLADALELAEQANRSLRNAQATWGRYKERNLGGADSLLTAAETTRDASKYTLMALATVASGGTATLVAVAGTSAIDIADAAGRAALGEKVDWGALALDVVINIVTAKFGGKLSQRILGKLLVNPRAQAIASRYLVQAIHSMINGAESRLIRGYIQGLYKTVTTSLTADEFIDQLLQQLFDPKAIFIDTVLGLGQGYAVGRPPAPAKPPQPAATHPSNEPQSPASGTPGQQQARKGGAEAPGIEPENVRTERPIPKEKAEATEPVVDPQSQEKHEIVGTKEGLGRCSASPCPAISIVYAKELAANPEFAARYKKIRELGATDVTKATKEAATLASDIEAYKHASAAVSSKLAPQIAEVQAELKQAREATVDYQAARKEAGKSLKGGPIKGIWNAKERMWILMRQIANPNRTILEQARIVGVKSADGTIQPTSSISGTGRTPDFVEVRGSEVVGGDLKSGKELMSSVKGGLHTDKLEGDFRDSSKVGGQHIVEGKIIKAAQDSKGVIVLEGRNVLTGAVQTIEVPADKYRSEVLTYDDVRPN